MMRKGSLPIMALLAVSACSRDTTAPNDLHGAPTMVSRADTTVAEDIALPEHHGSGNPVVSRVTTNRWEVWTLSWYSACANEQFNDALMNVHIVDITRTYADGTVNFKEHLSVPSVTLTDAAGNRFHFTETSNGGQVSLPSGNYSASYTYHFRLVERGRGGIREFVVATIGITWDGTDLTVTSSQVTSCR